MFGLRFRTLRLRDFLLRTVLGANQSWYRNQEANDLWYFMAISNCMRVDFQDEAIAALLDESKYCGQQRCFGANWSILRNPSSDTASGAQFSFGICDGRLHLPSLMPAFRLVYGQKAWMTTSDLAYAFHKEVPIASTLQHLSHWNA